MKNWTLGKSANCNVVLANYALESDDYDDDSNDSKCGDCNLNESLRHRKSMDLSENSNFYKKIGTQKLFCNRDFVGRIENVTFSICS
jgi:hypothetical protein